MEALKIPAEKPMSSELKRLESRCKAVVKSLRSEDCEVRLPLFLEFAGSPKSGKTTIIGIVAHFLRRMGLDVIQPAEGASVRTPPGLRDDWLSFNAWAGCYALQEILVDCHADKPPDIILLDRGLFDVAGWMQFLQSSQKRIDEKDADSMIAFFTSDLWARRESGVFLFTADHETSLKREVEGKLTTKPGSVMNAETLGQLRQAYQDIAERLGTQFNRLYSVDTSFRNGNSPNFQQIAFMVASKMVDILEELTDQMLLVTKTVGFDGFVTEDKEIRDNTDRILKGGSPDFVNREEAEKSGEMQQVVPYALLINDEDRYFHARRRHDVRRKELRRKHTILVGGHAEKRDWKPGDPASIFEQCLRRELEEELVGIRIVDIKPIGFISDTRNEMGSHHLAFVHLVKVGGKTAIRRQAIDQEFGRETVSWKSKDEIKKLIADLDPWSQLVASRLFGAKLPTVHRQETLFSNNAEAQET